ncbi:MAG: PAS domain-containing sensor histidine kinase [Bacteroidales bacterium]|nr:PAS domain-containing sensor histidine kinase [Bacteroidales bacterium]
MINNDKTKEELAKELDELKQALDALKLSFEEDINKRELIEKALSESESKYRLLAQNSSDVIWTLDTNFRFTYISPSIYYLRGFTSEEAMKETIQETMTPHSQEIISKAIAKGIKNQEAKIYKPVQIEIEQYHKEGRLIWVEISIRAMLNDQGEQIGYVGISRDITQRKTAEEVLRQSEEKFRVLANVAKVMISIVEDAAGKKYLFMNDEWHRVLGYNRDEVQNMEPMDFVAPESKQEVLDNAAKRMQGKQAPVSYEVKVVTKSGEIRQLDFSATVITFQNKKALLTTAIDISERKKTEEALRESETKLRELNAQKDKFFSIIAHDLKSPFNAIVGFSELLMEQINEKNYEGIHEYAKIISQSSLQAMDLLMNLLEWSRAQSGRMLFIPEKMKLVDLIEENILLFQGIARQKSITINKFLPDKITVFADESMIGTVLRNLISNAIKFTSKGGEINISAVKRLKEVLVSVSDNGIGIAPQRLEKLFRIDEGDSTRGTNDEKGTGLGLILCKEFVENHGGTIGAESKEGKGSTFYFSLPNNAQ